MAAGTQRAPEIFVLQKLKQNFKIPAEQIRFHGQSQRWDVVSINSGRQPVVHHFLLGLLDRVKIVS
jgi:hypothetical protein